jgi:hypothetical protein
MERLIKVPNRPVRFGSIEAMRNPVELEALLGKVDEVRSAPFATGGYSGSVHERWTVERDGGQPLRLVLKITRPAEDWTAFRTGDTSGREALLLGAPELGELWSVFHCCYRGYATKGGEVALLMDDLGEHLFPDEDEPISVADEDTLLGTLAAMHARFWKSDALELAWLNTPEQFLTVLGPDSGAPFALSDMVREGWRSALARLPSAVVSLLRTPSHVLVRTWCEGLPFTLLHGDAKLANFAVLPGDRCAAIDWALVGAGPATVDLGWYLAVNAGRLARPKDEVIADIDPFSNPELNMDWPRGNGSECSTSACCAAR